MRNTVLRVGDWVSIALVLAIFLWRRDIGPFSPEVLALGVLGIYTILRGLLWPWPPTRAGRISRGIVVGLGLAVLAWASILWW